MKKIIKQKLNITNAAFLCGPTVGSSHYWGLRSHGQRPRGMWEGGSCIEKGKGAGGLVGEGPGQFSQGDVSAFVLCWSLLPVVAIIVGSDFQHGEEIVMRLQGMWKHGQSLVDLTDKSTALGKSCHPVLKGQ